jgi:Flp pilus assembly pilin Flp
MMDMLRYAWRKLKEERGEVSVEWVMVAVIMAIMILTVFSPGVSGALTAAIGSISGAISSAAG